MAGKKTVIVTGASQGIGAAVVQAFLDRGYNVIATARSVARKARPAHRRFARAQCTGLVSRARAW